MKLTKDILKLQGTNMLEGKTVRWSAPAYSGNHPYGGEAKIIAIIPGDSHPVHAVTIDGDDLNWAFWAFDDVDDALAYSDAGRFVELDIL